ncbi:transposase, IS605 OrfB family, central region [Desulforamulus putei DSM 12395]|uniref:Transposase, IS605 OrfB family, central region n=1 Tax=Desulforamulus putei DSM 12395 TaxID=1121429 RepID=A0A1M4ZGY9_9FIRM|nr:RNA-guided endonuclease TnpB family protein [Desulforamulus putei]SHF17218.1 transposase, IS605 OrfB family, central region [Desulforamulus putei DSM 12395]
MKRKKKKYDELGQLIVEEHEEPYQLLTTKAKIINLSNQDALLLGLAGYAATKMWNVANHERRTVWQETGKIPGFPEQCKALKTNRWYKLLPSQTAQEILAELDDSYRSWYSHRKNGNKLAKPPGFRKKDTLSTLTFKQNAFAMPDIGQIVLKLPRTYARRVVTLEYKLPPETTLGKVQQVKLSYEHKTGSWYLLIYHKVKVNYLPLQNIMALDLGIVNIITGYITNGKSFIFPGGELLALDRYFNKMKAKTNSTKSRKCRFLNRKWSRQRNHFLHVLTKRVIDQAEANNVSHIIVGELKGIRLNKNWGAKQNQELHTWPYRRIIQMLRYKAALRGILVEEVSERNTSTTCPLCSKRVKSARVERGLFVHCGKAFNADVVGAFNILQKYLRDNGLPLLEVVGALARPVVNLFVWRKTTPLGREQGTFKLAA